jgi:hypothetical protein
VRGQSRRQRLFWGLFVLEMILFLGWGLTHVDGFAWGRDEGIYMMRVRLLQDGYRLYREIWTDQLPGVIELLWAVSALFGASVEAGRAIIVMLTAIGLFSTAMLARQLGGRIGALGVVPLLALAPNIFWLSRAVVSPDLPATSLGIAGLAGLGRYVQVRHRRWLVLSGLVLAAGLYIKATTVLMIVPAGVWLLLDWWGSPERDVPTLLSRVLAWGASIALPFGLALAMHDLPAFWTQFVVTQIASGQMALKVGPHAVKILCYLGEHNWGLATLAIAGTVVAVRRRAQTAVIVWTWLTTSLIALLLRSPLWPSHHLVVLLPPLAVLGGTGLSALVTSLHQHRSRIPADALLVAGAVVIYAASLPGIISADSKLLAAPTYQSSLEAVTFLRDSLSPGAMVVSDYHMIPFRAGFRVPPELATVSKKRIQLGLLGPDEVIRIVEQHQPEAVVLWDEELLRNGEYVGWLKAHYTMAFRRGYHEIYRPLPPDAIQYPQEAHLEQVLHLRGYSLGALAADPGGVLDVTLYWQVLAPIAHRYHGFVHLIMPDGDMISQQDQVAWGEQYPSTAWQVGETIVDRYTLGVPTDTAPGHYVLSVGLYDGETHKRLAAWDTQGQRLGGDQIILDVRPVVRAPAQYQSPAVGHPVGVQLGNLARLVGYDLTRAPDTLEITLVWEALAASGRPGYTVFVHLRGDEGLVTQHDGLPGEGEQPTLGWRPGEFISDRHTLSLGDVPGGDYSLFVGMYDPTTGERLPVVDASGAPLPAGEVGLGPVTIPQAGQP